MKSSGLSRMKESGIIEFFHTHPKTFAAALFALVAVGCYGLVIPFLGFYGDDWAYIWLLSRGGGIDVFFQNARENIAPIYKFLYLFLGERPLAWQVYNLFLRWINAFLFWLILEKLWPSSKKSNLLAAVLSLVYPAYRLSYVAVNVSIFFLVLDFFYLSIYLHLRSIQERSIRWLFLPIGLFFSYLNITLTEYFFFMELIRPVLIFILVQRLGKTITSSIKKTLVHWLPFFVLYLGAILWRMVGQSQINAYYSLKLVDDFKVDPFATLGQQILQSARDITTSAFTGWWHAIYPDQWLKNQHFSYYLYSIPFVVITVVVFLFLRRYSDKNNPNTQSLQPAGMWILVGLVWCLVSGWPVWLAELRIFDDFSTTRFTLPFLPGSILMVVGLLQLLSRFPKIQILFASILISSSIVYQVLIGNAYRMDWFKQKEVYTQLYWRFEGFTPGTLFSFSKSPSTEGEENSFSAAINWLFSKSEGKRELDYYGYFIPERFDYGTQGIFDGDPFTSGHLVGPFTATRDKIVAIEIDPRNCIRVLYPGLDESDPHLSDINRQTAQYSNPSAVQAEARLDTYDQLVKMFGPELEHGWCWMYQRADRMRQQGDWQGIAQLAQDIQPQEYARDWQKLALFVEAFAHIGNQNRAAELLQVMNSFPPEEKVVYCRMTTAWLTDMDPTGKFLDEINHGRKSMKCSYE